MHFSKHILKNGTRVVLVPMKDSQTITVQILVEAGSKYENKQNNGISHFLEHMMFKGTKQHPTPEEIAELLDSVGGEYNAFTGKEETGYWMKVPANHFDLALTVVSDIYLNSLFKAKEIEKERGVILQEINMIKDTPMRHLWDIFENLLYGNQPAGRDIIGTENNIKKFKRKNFIEYFKNKYTPQSTVVVVAGLFNEETALKKITKLFNKKNSFVKKVGKKRVVENQKRPAVKINFKETDQTHLLMGFRAFSMFNSDRHALSLLGNILGGGMSSRLFSEIREKRGLAYYVRAGAEMNTDTGYLYANAGIEHNNLSKTITLILKEFKKITVKKITLKELKKVKEFVKGRTQMSLESSDEMGSFFGGQELHRKKIKSPEELFKKIDSVSAEDIQRVAKKVIKNKSLNLAIIGPHKNKTVLNNILKI